MKFQTISWGTSSQTVCKPSNIIHRELEELRIFRYYTSSVEHWPPIILPGFESPGQVVNNPILVCMNVVQSSNYIKEVFFGNSRLSHHGSCCQFGSLVEIDFAAGCKQNLL